MVINQISTYPMEHNSPEYRYCTHMFRSLEPLVALHTQTSAFLHLTVSLYDSLIWNVSSTTADDLSGITIAFYTQNVEFDQCLQKAVNNKIELLLLLLLFDLLLEPFQ